MPRQQERSAEKLNVPMKASTLKKLRTVLQESGLSLMLVAVIQEVRCQPDKTGRPAECAHAVTTDKVAIVCGRISNIKDDMNACIF